MHLSPLPPDYLSGKYLKGINLKEKRKTNPDIELKQKKIHAYEQEINGSIKDNELDSPLVAHYKLIYTFANRYKMLLHPSQRLYAISTRFINDFTILDK